MERLGYVWQTVAYTIHAMEWIQREESKALLGQFTSRQEEMLRALLLAAALHPAQMQQNVITLDIPLSSSGIRQQQALIKYIYIYVILTKKTSSH